MNIATLIATPGKLEELHVTTLLSAWGGTEPVWLSPNEAAEFELEFIPDNRWEIWEEFQQLGIDLIVQPAPDRKKRMLLADMDSTMIQQECIDELADAAGVGEQVKDITARAMNGELDFEEALRERVALLEGQDAGIVENVLDTRITMMPGGAELVATMRANGAYAALVSGGFTAFAEPVAARLGFDEARANTLLFESGNLTGKVRDPILGRDAKVAALQEISAARGLTPTDVLAVGDGANDLGMLGLAGMGVALHAKPIVAAECDIRINHGNLKSLLFIQGYSRDEFVTG